MNKTVTAAALVVSIAFYFTPHLTVYNMKKAAEAKDVDTLSGYIDYPALRESLKANINAKIATKLAQSQPGDLSDAFAAAVVTALIGPMIEYLVTPESLLMLMKAEEPQLNKTTSQSINNNQSNEPNTQTSISYSSFNRFVVKVKKKENTEQQIEFTFKRDGLISWKLISLRLPLKWL